MLHLLISIKNNDICELLEYFQHNRHSIRLKRIITKEACVLYFSILIHILQSSICNILVSLPQKKNTYFADAYLHTFSN